MYVCARELYSDLFVLALQRFAFWVFSPIFDHHNIVRDVIFPYVYWVIFRAFLTEW